MILGQWFYLLRKRFERYQVVQVFGRPRLGFERESFWFQFMFKWRSFSRIAVGPNVSRQQVGLPYVICSLGLERKTERIFAQIQSIENFGGLEIFGFGRKILEAVRMRLLHFSSFSPLTSERQISNRSQPEIEPQLGDFLPQQFHLNETRSSSASTSTSFSTTTSSFSAPIKSVLRLEESITRRQLLFVQGWSTQFDESHRDRSHFLTRNDLSRSSRSRIHNK